MNFIYDVLDMLQIAIGCSVLGFFGAFGVISGFWFGTRLYEDKEESGHGVIGH